MRDMFRAIRRIVEEFTDVKVIDPVHLKPDVYKRQTENHALAGILTKAMYAMPQNLVEDLAAQYTTYKATELTFVDWIRLYPVVTVWALSLIHI